MELIVNLPYSHLPFPKKINMKNKTLLVLGIIAILGTVTLFSFRYAEDSKAKETYCMIMGTRMLLSNKVTITIDYGQETKIFSDTRIKDETGKVEKFNSMIDALNYMSEQGWEFVNAYPITTSNSLVYHYILKKQVKTADGK
ncbi:MAG: hypothetical protein MUC87_11380 [Bacteroidia bacterium]|jgi:hypothetical protein|nr:hypothetical protein [Bacteroidia bacterium]